MADRDRNLLFGIFAVQLKKVGPGQLMEIAGAWAVDPSRDLSQRLVDAGHLSERDRELLAGLVEDAVARCGGDVAASLAAFGGDAQVDQSFRGSIIISGSGVSVAPMMGAPVEELDTIPAVQEFPGRYSQMGEYARGGMGRVLLVHDAHLGRDIALKELLPGSSGAPGSDQPTPVRLAVPMIARFLQEARITGQLEHPAIVPVYEIGHRNDGTLYYTMKLVRGRTLAAAIKEAGSLEARLALLPHFVDLCQAIAYAHSRGVIHRDIKPANVMVGEFGETVVLDWGLAKARNQRDVHADGLAETLRAMSLGDEAESAKTAYGHALGTPAYMPPEQAKGDLDAVDEQSDVYSLGAVLYELLTGHAPFEGGTIFNILYRVLNENPPTIASIEREAPPELIAICERAMRKDPTARYASAKDLADEIERFQSGAMVQSYQYHNTELLRRFVRRHKAILATATAALVILFALGIISYLRERELRLATENELYRANVMLAQDRVDDNAIPLALDALWSCPERCRHWEWGYVLGQIDRGCLATLRHSNIVTSASFNPDGTRLVTTSQNYTAKVWDAASGQEIATLKGHARVVEDASFSPDGARIVTSSCDNTAKVWDATSGQEIATFTGHAGPVHSASFSPDGTRIVTVSRDKKAKVWDAASGREIATLEGHVEHLSSASFSPDGTRVVTGSNSTAKVWDTISGQEIATFTRHAEPVHSASFSPDGTRIVTVSRDKKAKVWDAASGREIATLEGHVEYSSSASFSPDGTRILAPSCGDLKAKVWDAESGREIITLKGHSFDVCSGSFSPDGTRVVTASYDCTAKVWDVTSAEEAATLESHSGRVKSSRSSPDGTRVVAVSPGNTAKVCDAVSGREIITLKGHSSSVYSGSFSPDGARIVTVSYDQTAKVWDAASGRELATLKGISLGLFFVWFSSDGRRIVAAPKDGPVRTWEAAPYRFNDLPGDTSMAWKTRYALWRVEEEARLRADLARVRQEDLVLVPGKAEGALRAYAASIVNEAPGSLANCLGLWVEEGYDARARETLEWWVDDRIARVNDAEVKSITSFKKAVGRFLDAPKDTPLVIELLRNNRKYVLRYTPSKISTEQKDSQFPSVAFSPDGLRIITGSGDKTVNLWDAMPWTADALPGDSSMPLDERLELWNRERITNASKRSAEIKQSQSNSGS